MKAFLLAAGNGTRLRPLTDTVPKCLLPIRGTPLLGIWLELCKRHGIAEILINAHAHPALVRDYLRSSRTGLKVRVFEEATLLGSAGTLAANRGWVSGDAAFWVLYADVLTNIDLTAMWRDQANRTEAARLAVYRVDEPSRCGIADVNASGVVTRFVEKPEHPPGNLAFTGVLLGTPKMLDFIPDTRPADLGFDVLPRLAGDMSAYETNAYFLDIGTLANYEKAQDTWPGI